MRQVRPVFSLLVILVILMLPASSAIAQSGASANANSSANASANAGSANAKADAQVKAEAQAKLDAQAKAEAAKQAAARAKAEGQAKAEAAKQAAAQAKAAGQAKADAAKQDAAKTRADAQAKAEAQAKADAQADIKLKAPAWQVVLDRLFGTPENGLLDGKKAFQFRAEDVSLTADQSASFFSSSATSSQDLAALIEAAAALHGQVRMDGTIEGKPFELKLAGRELKLEGLTLTTAQRESLMTELRGISGLHEMKIEAIVDGRASVIHVAGGRERIELLGRDRDDSGRSEGKKVEIGSRADVNGKVEIDRAQKIDVEHRAETGGRVEVDRAQKIDVEHRTETSGRVEVDRPARVETEGRVETSGRIGGVIEKPELPRIGK